MNQQLPAAVSPQQRLPRDLWWRILSLLAHGDRWRLRRVSKQFRRWVEADELYRLVLGPQQSALPGLGWLDTFLVREALGGRYWPGAERLYDAWALLRSAVAARAYPSVRYFARLCCGLATAARSIEVRSVAEQLRFGSVPYDWSRTPDLPRLLQRTGQCLCEELWRPARL